MTFANRKRKDTIKMKKRFMTLAALCVTGTVLLTGCGSTQKETEKATEKVTEAASEVVLETEAATTEAASEAESETEAASEAESETEAASEAESETEAATTEAASEAESETEAATTEAATEAESETEAATTEAATEAESETEAATTEAATEAESETEAATTEAATEAESETEAATTEAESETEAATTEAATEAESETEAATTEAATEAESETEAATTEAATEAESETEAATTEAATEAESETEAATTEAATEAESETEAATTEAAPVDVEKIELTLATGGETGTYYAVGNVMATTLNPLLNYSDIKVVVSGGSQDDIIRIEDGEAQLATVQNDVMSYAMNGTDTFEELGACTNFRAIAGLYDETCQIISTDPDIKTVADLEGKTVSVGDAGSGVEFNARQILEAYDLTFDDITPVNSSFGDSASSLKDGKIDAAFITAGAPTVAVTDLATTNDVNVVAIDEEHAEKLVEEHPFYTQTVIPAGTYKGTDEDVATVAVRATLIASADLSDDLVYELTKSLFENQETMLSAHAKFEELSVETALDGIDVEFHPGAQKYYEEVGAWK